MSTQQKIRKYLVKFLACYTVFLFVMFTAGCNTAWTTEAVSIINMLDPAIIALLAILTSFGVGITPSALAAIQKWSTEATTALSTVIKPLIEQYNTAESAAKPGILAEIQTAIDVLTNNLAAVLTTVHITDPATAARVMAVVDAVSAELQALANLIPVLQGKITDHHEAKMRVVAVASPREFRAHFNAAAGLFGSNYQI